MNTNVYMAPSKQLCAPPSKMRPWSLRKASAAALIPALKLSDESP